VAGPATHPFPGPARRRRRGGLSRDRVRRPDRAPTWGRHGPPPALDRVRQDLSSTPGCRPKSGQRSPRGWSLAPRAPAVCDGRGVRDSSCRPFGRRRLPWPRRPRIGYSYGPPFKDAWSWSRFALVIPLRPSSAVFGRPGIGSPSSRDPRAAACSLVSDWPSPMRLRLSTVMRRGWSDFGGTLARAGRAGDQRSCSPGRPCAAFVTLLPWAASKRTQPPLCQGLWPLVARSARAW